MAETPQQLAWRNRGYQDALAGRPPHDPASVGWKRATASERAAYLAGRRNARATIDREAQATG